MGRINRNRRIIGGFSMGVLYYWLCYQQIKNIHIPKVYSYQNQVIQFKCRFQSYTSLLFLPTLLLCSSILTPSNLALTIYNNNFGMVKDTRLIHFSPGQSFLSFTDVASTIQPQTVMFKPKDRSMQIYQQNYQYNLASKSTVMKNYLNENITMEVVQGNTVRSVEGELLSYSSGMILNTKMGVSMYEESAIGAVHLKNLTEGILTKPTLVWKVFAEKQTETQCEVAYRATGFQWKADYLMTVNEKEDRMDFAGWVTVDNNSGKKYANATLKLIAGEVNTVVNRPVPRPKAMYLRTGGGAALPGQPSFKQKSFADYHMYTLSRRVDLNQSSRKQIQFIPTATNIPILKFYKISLTTGSSSQSSLPIKSTLKFLNSKQHTLGVPLPKGTIRVFKIDPSDNTLQFLGEDSINHTPKDQNVTVTIGTAFDIIARTIVQKKETVSNGFDQTTRLEVVNRGDRKARVQVEMGNYYGDNDVVKQKGEKNRWVRENAEKYTLEVEVEGNNTEVVRWEETYRY